MPLSSCQNISRLLSITTNYCALSITQPLTRHVTSRSIEISVQKAHIFTIPNFAKHKRKPSAKSSSRVSKMTVDTVGYIGIAIALAALVAMGGYIGHRLCTKRGRAIRSNTHKQPMADIEAKAAEKPYNMHHAPVRPQHSPGALSGGGSTLTNFGASRGFQHERPKPAVTRGAINTTRPVILRPSRVEAKGHRTSKGEVDLWMSEFPVSLARVDPEELEQHHSDPDDIYFEPDHGRTWI